MPCYRWSVIIISSLAKKEDELRVRIHSSPTNGRFWIVEWFEDCSYRRECYRRHGESAIGVKNEMLNSL